MRHSVVVVVAALFAGGCGSDAKQPAPCASGTATECPDAMPPGLAWTPCGSYECAAVDVPADDVDPGNGTIALRVWRARARTAASRIGTLVWIVGGPGISGVRVAPAVYQDFAARLPDVADRFDVVFYERRGAGGTLTCVDNAWVDDYRATAPDPKTTADWAAADAIWLRVASGCTPAVLGYPLRFLSSDTEARDIDRIRAALGEATITYYAVSGGTNAGASYATQFSNHIRVGVIDSPSFAGTSMFTTWLDGSVAQEAGLDAFFADCGADAACAFHGGQGTNAVAAAYDALATSLATPLPVGGRSVGTFDLVYATQALLAGTGGELAAIRGPLATMLSTAAAGDGSGVLNTSDPWWYRSGGGYDTALWSIGLMFFLADEQCPLAFDLAAAKAMWPSAVAVAPRMAAGWFNQALSCLHWPTPRATPLQIGPSGTPVLVVSGMHDLNVGGVPAGMKLVTALGPKASLVRRDGYGHEQWLRSVCIAATESSFLVAPESWGPPSGSVCASGT